MNKKYLYGGLIVLALVAVLGGYALTRNAAGAPDLNRPFEPRADLPESIREESKQKVASAIAELRDNPELISRWLEVAIYRKSAEDYQGAEEIWVYLTKKWPDDPVAYNNLADLYQNYLKQYDKAESYWRKLLELQPDNTAAYRNLADLYMFKLSDKAKAVAVLQEGLDKNPKGLDLLLHLGTLERDYGDKKEARRYFEEARIVAVEIGSTGVVERIDNELRTLPQ